MFRIAHGRRPGIGSAFALGALIALCACTPPGPRALLKGDRLLRDGRASEALPHLEKAVELLPEDARAWNHLGLAYHRNGQPEQAREAYQRALALDRNLAAVRFNLGCLLLEHDDPQSAVQELTSFTGLRVDSAIGWLKLGHAQLRAAQPAAAENSFGQVLRLDTNSAAAMNGLGLSYLHRRRPTEAWPYFVAAARQQPDYPPAQLNIAILAQQVLHNPELAYRAYERYLAIPNTPNRDEVRSILLQLRPQPAPGGTNESATAAVTSPPASQPTPERPSTETPSRPQPTTPATPSRSDPAPTQLASRTPAETSDRPRGDERPALADRQTNAAPQSAGDTAPTRPLTSSPTRTSAPPAHAESRPSTNPPALVARDTRSAPAASRARPAKPIPTNAPPTTPTPTPSPVEPPPPAAKVAIPSFLRNPGVGYPYADFGRPSAGDRAEAVRLLNDGINAHRSFKVDQALDLYRQAAEVDPSLFEAHYNRGVACFEAGELGESLRAYERALAVDPDSVPARFNFATTLQKSGYPADAVAQLDHLVKAHPEETRAHLALGNLYTDTFRDVGRAREHYRLVLELDPQHPNATSLRFWLEAH